MVAPLISLFGFFLDDERISWASITFFIYSWICLLTACTTAPRAFSTSLSERAFVGISFSIICFTFGLNGMVLKSAQSRESHILTNTLGWVCTVLGFVFTLLAPFINLTLVKIIDETHTDIEINEYIMRQLQKNPSILCTSLYLSSAATKAILNADKDAPLLLQVRPNSPLRSQITLNPAQLQRFCCVAI